MFNISKDEILCNEMKSKSISIEIDKVTLGVGDYHDVILHSLYSDYYSGKSKGKITKIDISKIREGGNYLDAKNNLVYKKETTFNKFSVDEKERLVEDQIYNILQGNRPLLVVYECFLNGSNKYVCNDDVLSYYAYKKLKFKFLPVLILGETNNLEHSGLVVEYIGQDYKPFSRLIDSVDFGSELNSFETIFNKSDSLTYVESILKIEIDEWDNLRIEYNELCYNDFMYSYCFRAAEIVSSVNVLLNERKLMDALIITRSLLELYFSFYLDWVTSFKLDMYYKISSCIGKKDIKSFLEDYFFYEFDQRGLNSKKNKLKIQKKVNYGLNLLSVVSIKAGFSKIPDGLVKRLYKDLSRVVHSDYTIISSIIKDTKNYQEEEGWIKLVIKVLATQFVLLSRYDFPDNRKLKP